MSNWRKINILLDIYLIFYWTITGILFATHNIKLDGFQYTLLFINSVWLWVWFLIEDLTGRR